MRTINHAETRSLAIASPPSAVHAYLADALNMPAWAPGFAPRIRPDGPSWIVTGPDGGFRMEVLAERAAGTVDIVSASDHRRGLFTRVVPNADGTELLFTLMFPWD